MYAQQHDHDFLPLFDDDDEPAPTTARFSSTELSQLVALTVPPGGDDHTPFQGAPSLDLIVLAAGAESDDVTLMRALYASGDAESALALAAAIGRSSNFEPSCPELCLEDVDGTLGW